MRSMTEGAAAAVYGQRDACALCDAADVAVDVFVGVQPELGHGDEALVHGLGCSRTGAVVVRDFHV